DEAPGRIEEAAAPGVGVAGADQERAVGELLHALREVQAGGEGRDPEVGRADARVAPDGERGGQQGAAFEPIEPRTTSGGRLTSTTMRPFEGAGQGEDHATFLEGRVNRDATMARAPPATEPTRNGGGHDEMLKYARPGLP